MVPKAWRIFKYKKLTLIQKFLRGYVVHKRVYTELTGIKLQSAFEYFDKVKAVLKVNSQIKIRYYYFRWKRLMKIKQEEDAKNKAKKKGKKGSMLRKGNASFRNNNIANSPSMKKIPSKESNDTASSKSVIPNKSEKSIDPSSPTKKSQFYNNEPKSPGMIESVLEEDYEEDEELNKDIL